MTELAQGEESAAAFLGAAAAGGVGVGGGGGDAAAGGGGQAQQQLRVSGLLKSEMSALPSLAGFGMGGNVSVRSMASW